MELIALLEHLSSQRILQTARKSQPKRTHRRAAALGWFGSKGSPSCRPRRGRGLRGSGRTFFGAAQNLILPSVLERKGAEQLPA